MGTGLHLTHCLWRAKAHDLMGKSKSRVLLWSQKPGKASNSGTLVRVGRGALLRSRKERAEDLCGSGTPNALALCSPTALPELVGRQEVRPAWALWSPDSKACRGGLT